MRTLNFVVDHQTLRKQPGCDFSRIVVGSVDYLKAKFHFSGSDWDGCKKVVSFWYGDGESVNILLDADDSCGIPSEALTGQVFEVSVNGGRPDGYRITTNKFRVRQEVS